MKNETDDMGSERVMLGQREYIDPREEAAARVVQLRKDAAKTDRAVLMGRDGMDVGQAIECIVLMAIRSPLRCNVTCRPEPRGRSDESKRKKRWSNE